MNNDALVDPSMHPSIIMHTTHGTDPTARTHLSKMMTVSAAVRLMPTPPARVERRKMGKAESGALNLLWWCVCVGRWVWRIHS